MGQKVNPIGLRLGVNRTWDSRWFADGDYAELLLADLEMRKFLDIAHGVKRYIFQKPFGYCFHRSAPL